MNRSLKGPCSHDKSSSGGIFDDQVNNVIVESVHYVYVCSMSNCVKLMLPLTRCLGECKEDNFS
jgi:hypothetical protein